jgi:hypothetical protein
LARPIDVYFVVDTSDSFNSGLENFRQQARDIIAHFEGNPMVRFGLAEFSDYPLPPYGSAIDRDSAYRRRVDLTTNRAAVLEAIDRLRIRNGGDTAESQLAALFQAATGAGQDLNGDGDYEDLGDIPPQQQASFRSDGCAFIVLYTDAPFHRPEDGQNIGFPYPFRMNAAQVCDALNQRGIKVIGVAAPTAEEGQLGGVSPEEVAARLAQTINELKGVAQCTNTFAPKGGVDCGGDGPSADDLAAGTPLACEIASSGMGLASAIDRFGEVSLLAIDNPATAFDERTLVRIRPEIFRSGDVDLVAGGTFEFDVTFLCAAMGESVGRRFTFDVRAKICNGLFGRGAIDFTCERLVAVRCSANPTNPAPGEQVSLMGVAMTEPPGARGPIMYQWTQIAGPTVTIMNATSANASFRVPLPQAAGTVFSFRLVATCGLDTVQCEVSVMVRNVAPQCQAMAAPTDPAPRPGDTVTLTGQAADDNGAADITMVQWRQVSGPMVTLMCDPAANNRQVCRFAVPMAPAGTELVFEFTAMDRGGLTCTQAVRVRVGQ